MRELLTIDEAAERARCSSKTIRRMINVKRLPAKRVGWLWRIDAEMLERTMDLAARETRARRRSE